MRAREANDIDTYGSARWADRTEIERTGLLGPDGVVLGRYEREYLRHDGRSIFCALLRRARARASGWSCRVC